MTFLFDTSKVPARKDYILRALPNVPETNWRPPSYYPNLSGAQVIGYDVETFDPDLTTHGPGWSRGRGHIVGVSLAALASSGERGKWYFPIRHEVEGNYNLPIKPTIDYLRTTLQFTPHIPKIAANSIYDFGWLTEEDITVSGELHDVQFAEPLLGDSFEVNLEHLGSKYLNKGKTTDQLYKWCADAYGSAPDQRANIYRAPPRLVGPYAEDDADMPIDILLIQWQQMDMQGLLPVYRMECDLVPLLVAMRRKGIQIDIALAEKLYNDLTPKIKELYARLSRQYNVQTDKISSPGQLAKLFDAAGLEYPRTDRGNPSFQKEFLKSLHHPLADAVNEIREYEKTRSTFLRGYILEGHVNGKVYGQFHPLRSDDGGTITGRLSSSTPNLQNIPVRSELGKQIRKCFIKDHQDVLMRELDYSQIEYRMLAHFGIDGDFIDTEKILAFWQGLIPTWGGDGSSDALRASYVNDPKTDYHAVVMRNVAPLLGKDLSRMSADELDLFRKPIKNINFGLLYGETEKGLAYKAGLKPEDARAFFKAYHEGAPYVRPTMKGIQALVQKQGYIQTLLGRRVRFELWEADDYKKTVGLPYKLALGRYGAKIRRAYAYRGVNYKFQGSGTGDIPKAAMRLAWQSGVYDVIGVPRLQVHDALVHSMAEPEAAHAEAWREYRHILENSIPGLRVPIKVDEKEGHNWGELAKKS